MNAPTLAAEVAARRGRVRASRRAAIVTTVAAPFAAAAAAMSAHACIPGELALSPEAGSGDTASDVATETRGDEAYEARGSEAAAGDGARADASTSDSAVPDGSTADGGVLDATTEETEPTAVYCGAALRCVAPSVCCAASQDCAAPGYACVGSPSQCQGQGYGTISCHDGADCPGETCCGTELGPAFAPYYSDVSCTAVCGGGLAALYVVFCDPAAADCPAGTGCKPSQVLTDFFVCS